MSILKKSPEFHSNIAFILLCSTLVTLPFSFQLCSLTIILLVLNWIWEGRFKDKFSKLKNSRYFWVFISFYLLHILGLLYTEDVKEGMFDLEKKLALLVFPLVVGSISLNKDQVYKIILVFIGTCFLVTLVCYSNAFHQLIIYHTSDHFFLEKLTKPVGIHRVYFSMYLLFSIAAIIYFKTKSQIPYLKYLKALSIPLIIYFSIFIFLLASRMLIILLIVSAVFYFFYYFYVQKKLLLGIGISIGIMVLSIIIILSLDKTRVLMTEVFTNLHEGNNYLKASGPNLRMLEWQSAMELIKDHPILGVGTGDTDNELIKKYIKNNFEWGYTFKFNAHNQYLQTTIGLGIFGFLSLIGMLFYPAISAYKEKNYLYLFFIFLFSFCILTECMLCGQKGIIFYAFFNSLFAFQTLNRI